MSYVVRAEGLATNTDKIAAIYILNTDVRAIGKEALLPQVQKGKEERVIAYNSKTLAPPECNPCVTCRRLLVAVKATKHFCLYLYKTMFKFRTNYASL